MKLDCVPHDPRRGLVGKVFVPDEIAEPDLGRIDPEPARGSIHQALDHEHGGRPPDATVRPERRLAGRHAARPPPIGRYLVGPGQEADRLHRLDGSGPRIDRVGADVGGDLRAKPDDGAVRVQAELGVDDLVPGVRGREQVLAAIADPLHRAPESSRHHARGDLLGVERSLGAEAAAHVVRDHADLVLRHAQQVGQDVAHETGALRGRPQGERLAAGRVVREAAAVFHADRRVPVETKPLAHDERRAGQRAVDVTAGELAAHEQVRPGVLVQHRARRIERLVGVLHDRQRLELHDDVLDGVLGHVAALGRDHHDRLTHVTHLAEGQRRKARGLDARRLGLGAHRFRRARDVLAGQHRRDAGQRERRRRDRCARGGRGRAASGGRPRRASAADGGRRRSCPARSEDGDLRAAPRGRRRAAAGSLPRALSEPSARRRGWARRPGPR